jgi:hypothetical protein
MLARLRSVFASRGDLVRHIAEIGMGPGIGLEAAAAPARGEAGSWPAFAASTRRLSDDLQ